MSTPETVVFRIKRFDPEQDEAPHFEDIQIPVLPGATVLDYLLHIRGFVDGTVTFRYSCQSSICGSCAMKINGRTKLACKTQAHTVWDKAADGETVVVVEPMGNHTVIKDLVVLQDDFWKKYLAVRPTLQPKQPPPEDGSEYYVTPAQFDVQRLVAVCIQCGACYSECNSLAVNTNYLGPAALAKAFRFVTDPRDGATTERLLELVMDDGIWDCTRCCECTEVCPKDVGPMERIVELRTQALQLADEKRAAGDSATARALDGSDAARHVTCFASSVVRSGVLDETRLPIETIEADPGSLLVNLFTLQWGSVFQGTTKALGFAPLGLKMLTKGKMGMPYILHHPIENVGEVHRIARAMSTIKQQAEDEKKKAAEEAHQAFLVQKQKNTEKFANA